MKLGWLVGVLALVVTASVANAALTGWSCADDGDGAVTMGQVVWSWNSTTDEYTMTVPESMHRSPAHLEGDFTADSELDPTVWILKDVENGTSYAWSGYVFNIFMDKTFSVSNVSVPLGWSAVVTPVASGSFVDSHGNAWSNLGVVTFTSSSPASDIAIGSTGSFGAKVSFPGSVSFEIEQVATPEPATLALLALGGLFLRRARKA